MDSNTYNNNTTSTNTHNTHNPLTGDGVTNTHNPLTGDKIGPNPPPGTNPVTGRTKDDNLGRNQQPPPDSRQTNATGTGEGVASGINTNNTHNGPAGDGVPNTGSPMTGGKTDAHPPAGANPATGRTNDGNLGHHEKQPADYNDTTDAGTTGPRTGARTNTYTGAGTDTTLGANVHNTHNPLTGDGVSNTHNPVTGDKTGPHPPPGTDPVTGRTNDGNLGRHEQQPADHTDMAGARASTYTTGAHTGTLTGAGAGAGLSSGTDRNTHNPLTGDGITNTHNPLTGEKTGPHPPRDTNPVTGQTNYENLGRNEQQSATNATGTGPHDHAIHDTTRGVHTAGVGGATGTGPHPVNAKASGGGTKAAVGRVEATLGAMINNSEMHEKGVRKQDEAQAAKLAKQGAAHGGADVRH